MYYLYPRLTEDAMNRAYSDNSYYGGGDDGYSDTGYSDQEAALKATFRRLMENLKKRGLTGGQLLEIGCGFGYLLEEAGGYFDRRVGTEFSPEGVRRASAAADKVYQGGIEAVPSDERFDCIIATHVIEHVYKPQEFVRQLADHLNPGGAVVLAAPDMGGVLRKAMGRRWPSYKVPEHIHYFDSITLARLMKQGGLTRTEILPYPHAFPIGLIASKFKVPVPAAIGRLNLWVPATTVALVGRVSDESDN